MEVLATDFYFEPLAQFICVGTGRDPQTGDSPTAGAGGGHAAMGGGGNCCSLTIKLNFCWGLDIEIL